MKRFLALLLLAGLLSSCAPAAPDPPTEPAPVPTPTASLSLTRENYIQRLRAFSLQSAAVLFGDSAENQNYSPLSLSIALAMLSQGAEGETLEGILKAMHLEGSDPPAVALLMKELIPSLQQENEEGAVLLANGLFSDEGFPLKEEFRRKLEEDFGALAESLPLKDPASVERINRFILERTRSRIKDAYNPGPASEEVLLLINTLYANLPWFTPFDPQESAPRVFHAPDGDTDVAFMNSLLRAPYGEGEDYQAVSLRLGQGYKMTFVLPEEGSSPQELLKRGTLLEELQGLSTRKLSLSLPKFTFENTFDLGAPLKALGMEKAFSDSAEFSGISPEPTLVSSVLQKTFLDVNEAGVEAAAVTIVAMETTSAPAEEDPLPLVLDRPFLFLLESSEGIPLFLGILSNPAK